MHQWRVACSRYGTLLAYRQLCAGALVALAGLFPSQAGAQSTTIDADLLNGIDFRAVEYRDCFGAGLCVRDGLVMRAEARIAEAAPWQTAEFYWDPIDGLGVLGGGQDDEIDFNERIVIEFQSPTVIARIWLSDLFLGEIEHYLGISVARSRGEDFEVARLSLTTQSGAEQRVDISGRLDLPVTSFNGQVDGETFIENGDLRSRLIIRGPVAELVVPATDGDGETVITEFRLDTIEAGKLNLFGEGERLVYDLSEVFDETEALTLYPAGAHNAEAVEQLLDQPWRLTEAGDTARLQRRLGDIPNGEVAAVLTDVPPVTQIVLSSPAGSSNDFSIAGIVLGVVDLGDAR